MKLLLLCIVNKSHMKLTWWSCGIKRQSCLSTKHGQWSNLHLTLSGCWSAIGHNTGAKCFWLSTSVWQIAQHLVITCYINAELYIHQKSAVTVVWPNDAVSAVHKQPPRIVLKDAVTQKKRIILSLITTLLPLHHTKKIIKTRKTRTETIYCKTNAFLLAFFFFVFR